MEAEKNAPHSTIMPNFRSFFTPKTLFYAVKIIDFFEIKTWKIFLPLWSVFRGRPRPQFRSLFSIIFIFWFKKRENIILSYSGQKRLFGSGTRKKNKTGEIIIQHIFATYVFLPAVPSLCVLVYQPLQKGPFFYFDPFCAHLFCSFLLAKVIGGVIFYPVKF